MGPAGMVCPWCDTRLEWSDLGIDRTLGDALARVKPPEFDYDSASEESGSDKEEGTDERGVTSLAWDPTKQAWTVTVPGDDTTTLGQDPVDLTLSDSVSSDEADE